MFAQPLSKKVTQNLSQWARRLRTADPTDQVGGLMSRTFIHPQGDPRYAQNALTPMAAPLEPSFSEEQPNTLRFTVQPLPPEASGIDRRDEATREMHRLLRGFAGHEALRWFDKASENYRGFSAASPLEYGAFFGTSFDKDGLNTAKVYYETPHSAGGIDGLPPGLMQVVAAATQSLPGLIPLFTTIAARKNLGEQRLTFACTQAFQLTDLRPVLERLGLEHRLGSIMQTLGLVLGGRFEMPAHSTLLAFGNGADGPSFEIYVLLTAIPDVPPNFLSLLTMGLAERPKALRALERWMGAFTPDNEHWPGRFTIISLRTGRSMPPRVSLYLRPAEFELPQAQPTAA